MNELAVSGRPVARFVGVLAAIAVVLGVMWWSGLAAARVDVSVAEQQRDLVTGEGVALVTVRNDGRFDARVDSLDLEPYSGGYYEPPVRLVSWSPGRALTLASGAAAELVVRYDVDCSGVQEHISSPGGVVTPILRVRLHVTGRIGSGRSITDPEVALSGSCSEGTDAGAG